MTTDHVGSTCAHSYPHTKFRHCSPYRTLDICLFLLLANQNRYANEVLNMRIRWQQSTGIVVVSTTTHLPSFTKIGHCVHTKVDLFVVMLTSNLHPSIPTSGLNLLSHPQDTRTGQASRLFEMIIYWFFSQKCHILFHKKVGNLLQIIKYINLSRFQHILKL